MPSVLTHLVRHVVPVVVEGVDGGVGEAQDHQVVAGPGGVQEDDDGADNGHLAHRGPLQEEVNINNQVETAAVIINIQFVLTYNLF